MTELAPACADLFGGWGPSGVRVLGRIASAVAAASGAGEGRAMQSRFFAAVSGALALGCARVLLRAFSASALLGP